MGVGVLDFLWVRPLHTLRFPPSPGGGLILVPRGVAVGRVQRQGRKVLEVCASAGTGTASAQVGSWPPRAALPLATCLLACLGGAIPFWIEFVHYLKIPSKALARSYSLVMASRACTTTSPARLVR